jgi:hypothetical protein
VPLLSLGRLLFGGLLELVPDSPAHSGKRLPLTIEAGGGDKVGVTSGGHQQGDPRTGRATGQIVRIIARSSAVETASDLERTTGFEPATPTLARWCSTN